MVLSINHEFTAVEDGRMVHMFRTKTGWEKQRDALDVSLDDLIDCAKGVSGTRGHPEGARTTRALLVFGENTLGVDVTRKPLRSWIRMGVRVEMLPAIKSSKSLEDVGIAWYEKEFADELLPFEKKPEIKRNERGTVTLSELRKQR